MSRLNYLLTLTPLETWRLARRRLPSSRRQPAWTARELLSSSKHNRGIRFAELLLRQEAVVRRHMPWPALEFEGRAVVEIGCGPLGGFGPLAIFRGAEWFYSAEPEWDPQLFYGQEVREQYLRTFHADLVGLYGPLMDFGTFCGRLAERMEIARTGFQAASPERTPDVVLSQSCLEHVFPLEATVQALAAIQAPSTRFLHLVDFGNHYPTANPFEGLYEAPPDAYIGRRGKAINLKRAPDILATFEKVGISARLISSRVFAGGLQGAIHPWWRDRYDDAALTTQLALVAGPDS